MNWEFCVIIEIDLIKMKLLLIEVLCMPIEVREFEEIEQLGVLFSTGLGLIESSLSFEP